MYIRVLFFFAIIQVLGCQRYIVPDVYSIEDESWSHAYVPANCDMVYSDAQMEIYGIEKKLNLMIHKSKNTERFYSCVQQANLCARDLVSRVMSVDREGCNWQTSYDQRMLVESLRHGDFCKAAVICK
jgi:hypothetical protein